MTQHVLHQYNNGESIMYEKMLNFLRDEEGLTTVEYAVAGSLVALALVTAFTDLGEQVTAVIDGLTTAIGG
jgi:pilus assembly protein Flp/PilA